MNMASVEQLWEALYICLQIWTDGNWAVKGQDHVTSQNVFLAITHENSYDNYDKCVSVVMWLKG